MAYIDNLKELAKLYGVATQYWSADGEEIIVSEDTLTKTLLALDVKLSEPGIDPTEESLAQAIADFYEDLASRPLPPSVIIVEGDPHVFNVHVHDGTEAIVDIVLEDGTRLSANQVENWTPPREVNGQNWGEASFALPADLPLGWHRIELRSEGITADCALVVTPRRLSTTDKFLENPVTGVMSQMYSVRSKDSWGMGDFNDLGLTAEVVAKEADADFLLINPLHAAEPLPPIEDSPYLPTTRRFINPIYIRVEDIEEIDQLEPDLRGDVREMAEEFKALNSSSEPIDRNPIYEAKLQVLKEIFHLPRPPEREKAYVDYCEMEGKGLDDFARWCGQRELDQEEAQPNHGILPTLEETSEFYRWLQWICDEQLGRAQKRALEAGMDIGIMADLAVGVHPGGADAFNLADVLAPLASVGAPADGYNQQGQDWSQPPWHPRKLAEAGYGPWRDMLRTVLRHSGGIRIDHILGLFRLWWIPRMQSPLTGTYVYFDHNALVGILALEAERAGAVVIGEDLGTFEPWVQDVLASRGIMGTSILWFESSPYEDGPRRQHEYRELALSSVTTHDLPPTAGYLRGEHIELRDRLGVLTREPEIEDAEDLDWQNRVLDRVAETGCLEGHSAGDYHEKKRDERGEVEDLMVGLHKFIAGTPSALTCISLVDMVGEVRAQNQPGTTRDMYENWCVPLCDGNGKSVLIEDLSGNEMFHKIAEAGRR